MHRLHLLATSAVCLYTLCSCQPEGLARETSSRTPARITLKPEQSPVLRKTFRRELESEGKLSDRGGELSELAGGEVDAVATTSSTARSVLVVVDRVQSADGGRVSKLERTYEKIGGDRHEEVVFEVMKPKPLVERESEEASCALEGQAVTFDWDGGGGTYGVSGDLDDDLLTHLRFDLDLVGFLPDGEVAAGDEWELEAEAFQGVVDFMDGLPLEWAADPVVLEGWEPDEELEVHERIDGEITLTYAGTRMVDGAGLAMVEFEGELETERTEDYGGTADDESTFHSEEDETCQVEGVLLWDLEHGHAYSLVIEMELETKASETLTGSRDFHSQTRGTTGTVTLRADFERVED